MVDIHTHILPDVDDGSKSLNASLDMLRFACSIGCTDIFLTPHYSSVYQNEKNRLQQSFNSFIEVVKQNGIDVNLYLGQEVAIEFDGDYQFNKDKMLTLGGSEYILLEFPYFEFVDISEVVYEFKNIDLKPIVCHIERYAYCDEKMVRKIKSLGGLIQITADSICGDKSRENFKKSKKFVASGFVDFVASDVHELRNNKMAEAYKFVSKKFGNERAENLFTNNAQKILEEINSKG